VVIHGRAIIPSEDIESEREGKIAGGLGMDCAKEITGFFSPNGAQDDSPGHRPGNRIASSIRALKGRNNGGRLSCDAPRAFGWKVHI
jgi:hypothetical protein